MSKLDLGILAANRNIAARSYWKTRLEGTEFSNYFGESMAAGRPAAPAGFRETVSVIGSSLLLRELNNIAPSDRAKHIVLLAALAVMVQKYSSEEDICLFTPLPGGSSSGAVEGIVPFRISVSSGATFKGLLLAAKEAFVRDAGQARYPLGMMLETRGVEPDTVPATAMLLEEAVQVSELSSFTPDILFAFSAAGPLRLTIHFDPERCPADYIKLLPGLYLDLLQRLILQSGEPIDLFDLIHDEEKRRILEVFNRPAAVPQGEETVMHLFDSIVGQYPDNPAVICHGNTLTYRELKDASEGFAGYLQQRGVRPGDLVGMMLRREESLIPVLFGILKCGAAYVPIDPEYPEDWIKSVIRDSGLKLLITRGSYPGVELSGVAEVIDLDQEPGGRMTGYSSMASGIRTGSSDLAYVIYTSGSTGQPKGVMIEHGSLLNMVVCMQECYPLEPDDRYLLKTSCSFDVSVMELFGWIPGGGSVVVAETGAETDPGLLLQAIKDGGITHLNFVPTLFSVFVDRLTIDGMESARSLKYIFLAGEVLPGEVVEQALALGLPAHFENLYGPTEGTIYSSGYSIQKADGGAPVPIGKPLKNIRLYIVNGQSRLQPVGVAGELCASGAGVARGYLNNESLTSERFVPDPFEPGARMYKTGDRARWMPDGNIEFLDRMDRQLKIRGFRIEPREIETKLATYSGISRVAVIAKGAAMERCLVAYYESDTEIPAGELKQFAGERLPVYMVPDFYIRLRAFPVTLTGKLDWKRLPDPKIGQVRAYRGPSDEMERRMTVLWAEILRIDKDLIGKHRSFFELGGNSLRAMTLVNRIQEEMKIDISVGDVFDGQTVSALCDLVKAGEVSDSAPLKKAEAREYYDVSVSQLRGYYLCEFNRTSLTFNVPVAVKILGDLDREKVEAALALLVKRHDALRTSFRMIGDRPVQVIAPESAIRLEYHRAQEQDVEGVIKRFIRPFTLEQAPLCRAALIETAPLEFYFVVDMHHLVADGTSVGLLINDFMSLYKGELLPDIKLDYKDYSTWQQSASYRRRIARQKNFWVREFSEPLIPLDIPIDFNRPMDNKGVTIRFGFTEEETTRLKVLATEKTVTLSMIILSVLSILLSKLSGQEDIVIGITVAGREQVEQERMIGMFPLVLPLRTHPRATMTYNEFLATIKHTLLETFDNQSYQYEDLAQELNLGRSTDRNPWYDVLFLFQNFERFDFALPGLQMLSLPPQHVVAHEKLNLAVMEIGGQLLFEFIYSKTLFREETAERMARYFENILRAVLRTQTMAIGDVPAMDPGEMMALIQASGTRKDLDRIKTFSHLFREQAARTPDHTAVMHNGRSLTYAGLFEDSKRLASRLAASGVRERSHVAVLLGRGIDMLTSMLAIFHCGAVYVPVDIDFPEQRIEEIIHDSQSMAIISNRKQGRVIEALKERACPMIEIIYNDEEVQEDTTGAGELPDAKIAGDDAAYIIYTSGTTGKPKGVVIHHLGMINHMRAFIDIMGIDSQDVIAQTASACFDISVWQFLTALMTGGKTVIIDTEKVMEPRAFIRCLGEGGVSIVQSVPSLLAAILNDLPNDFSPSLGKIRWLLMTGEALDVALAREWYSRYPAIRMLNVYGPTEASDDITTYVVEPPTEDQLTIPVGKPIQNMQVYILDDRLHPCPIGVRGEICVAGIGVGKGYWNDEEKTKKVFVANTVLMGEADFMDPADPDFRTVYRTGDMGYYQQDGNIVCLGRKDEQVKIRGLRIEPAEIESRLMAHERISHALVLPVIINGEKQLVAYIIPDGSVSVADLRDFLAGTLPAYMVPGHYVMMESFPLTVNGKLDKKALPIPEVGKEDEFVPPSSEPEKKMVELWAQLLGIEKEKIGVTMNFFELGGNSLKILKLKAILHKMEGWDLSIPDFFRFPTILSLLQSVSEEGVGNDASGNGHGGAETVVDGMSDHSAMTVVEEMGKR
jgi:amino acid adenylation domain-containing protein